MILGKDLNWYLKIIKTPFIVVAAWIIFIGLAGKVPFLGWLFSLFVSPFTWVLKVGSGIYVGYQTVKKYKGELTQSLVSGGLFGLGIGLVSMLMTTIMRMILKPTVGRMFWGAFGLGVVIISEMTTGLILGILGGFLAGTAKD